MGTPPTLVFRLRRGVEGDPGTEERMGDALLWCDEVSSEDIRSALIDGRLTSWGSDPPPRAFDLRPFFFFWIGM
jgi:hypothetical protein